MQPVLIRKSKITKYHSRLLKIVILYRKECRSLGRQSTTLIIVGKDKDWLSISDWVRGYAGGHPYTQNSNTAEQYLYCVQENFSTTSIIIYIELLILVALLLTLFNTSVVKLFPLIRV